MKTVKSYDQGFEEQRIFITVEDYLNNKEIFDRYEFLPLEGTLEVEIQKRTFVEDKIVEKIGKTTIFYCEELYRFMTYDEYQKVNKE